jgi:hypothetical protein
MLSTSAACLADILGPCSFRPYRWALRHGRTIGRFPAITIYLHLYTVAQLHGMEFGEVTQYSYLVWHCDGSEIVAHCILHDFQLESLFQCPDTAMAAYGTLSKPDQTTRFCTLARCGNICQRHMLRSSCVCFNLIKRSVLRSQRDASMPRFRLNV